MSVKPQCSTTHIVGGPDMGFLIDKYTNTCFRIKILRLCIRTADKYERERENVNHGKERGPDRVKAMLIMAKNVVPTA